MTKKDITVIIPVYGEYETSKDMFKEAVESVGAMGKYEIMAVGNKEYLDNISKDFNGIKTLVNDGPLDFCSQINLAVRECKSEYFTILEFDDQYVKNWFSNVEKYEQFHKDVFAFLPLNELVLFDKKDEGAVSYANEPVWAASFSDELGYLDLDSLTNYPEFNMTGSVIKTREFEELGGLKPSMKISFWYEFMLRAAYNGKKMYVVPKVGYYHYLGRPDSLSEGYKNTVSQEEADWWMTLAQQEYFFKKDRNKTYDEE